MSRKMPEGLSKAAQVSLGDDAVSHVHFSNFQGLALPAGAGSRVTEYRRPALGRRPPPRGSFSKRGGAQASFWQCCCSRAFGSFRAGPASAGLPAGHNADLQSHALSQTVVCQCNRCIVLHTQQGTYSFRH